MGSGRGRVVVIVGTDTGVGKTWVGCGLGLAARKLGRDVVAIKPLETGCAPELRDDEDGAQLAASTGQDEPRRALVRLAAPVAPPEAADREGATLDLESIVAQIEAYAAAHELTYVEGAGGLLSPLTWEATAADLAQRLGAKVLLVARDALGTVSHVRLAVEASRARGLDLAGVVLTAPEAPDASTGSNARAIERLCAIRTFRAPRTTDPGARASSLTEVLAWLAP
jgi:dethiobiotin synthetase